MNSTEELTLKDLLKNQDDIFRTLVIIGVVLSSLVINRLTTFRPLKPNDLILTYFLFLAILTWSVGMMAKRPHVNYFLKLIGFYHLVLGLLISITLYLTYDYPPTRGENLLMMGIILLIDTATMLLLIRHINHPDYRFKASIFVPLLSVYTFVILLILL